MEDFMFINLNDKDYLYNQIYDSIKEKINTKQLKTNDKLPSIRKLSNGKGRIHSFQ